MADHTKEKIDRIRGLRSFDSETRSKVLAYWSQIFDDASLSNKIAAMIISGKLSNVLINERINNIVNLFEAYKHSKEDAKAFIIKNPILIEKPVDFINSNVLVISSIIANNPNTDFIDFIKSEKNNGSLLLINPSNLYGTYNLVFDMFESNGMSKQEAYRYLYDNKNLLHMSVDSILSKLSVLNLANLDEEVFFNKPSLLDHKILYSELYNAVAICQINNIVSIDNITNIISQTNKTAETITDINSKLVFKIDKETLELLKKYYLDGLLRDSEGFQLRQAMRVM